MFEELWKEISAFGNSGLFFDVPIWEQLLRVFGATILGAVFGFERELKNKPAGFITFMIVSLGSCIIALLQINIMRSMYFTSLTNTEFSAIATSDITRIIAQVVSGVGFLGAGTIIYNKGSIKGITTAAMLWVAAGIGLLVGMGGIANYIVATVTVVIFVPLSLMMRKYGRKITERYKVHRFFICYEEQYEKELYISFEEHNAVVKKSFFHNKYHHDDKNYKEIYIYFGIEKNGSYNEIVNAIASLDFVLSFEEM